LSIVVGSYPYNTMKISWLLLFVVVLMSLLLEVSGRHKHHGRHRDGKNTYYKRDRHGWKKDKTTTPETTTTTTPEEPPVNTEENEDDSQPKKVVTIHDLDYDQRFPKEHFRAIVLV